MSHENSREILSSLLDDFEIGPKTRNRDFLNHHLTQLAMNASTYKETSQSQDVSAVHRSRARDFEQNSYGLINGIKFALAFLDNKMFDLNGLVPSQSLTGGFKKEEN